ncbi:hypothetical protein GXW83_29655 [Streptacidiphilus sp. PB12-B1b]|uniref:RNA polymerase sigma factor n=1 Tax=Streptacidiphilus sp. PB12-B1b TaxID=2705012 RepID=UPI0015FAC765|nr:hypothetical protein [Streptacidiphilus sp. PB12-B1b]QMU79252.1 hypothetical protein GXW83_29655 [Streptacidiphilus sp. PB12-B1b]
MTDPKGNAAGRSRSTGRARTAKAAARNQGGTSQQGRERRQRPERPKTPAAPAPGAPSDPSDPSDPGGRPKADGPAEARSPAEAPAPAEPTPPTPDGPTADRPTAVGPAAPVAAPPARAVDGPATAAEPADFARLHDTAAVRLIRQTYLLTGSPERAADCVRRAFEQAWAEWAAVGLDVSPEGWVRAAAFDLALSPWQRGNLRLRSLLHRPGGPPTVPAVVVEPQELRADDRALVAALLRLPRAHRRALVLHDAIGLDWKQTSTETESTTPTAYRRVVLARASLAEAVPGLTGANPLARGFGRRLGGLLRTAAVRACPEPATGAGPDALQRRSARRERTLTVGAATVTLAVAGALTAGIVWGTPFHPGRMPFVTYGSLHGRQSAPSGPAQPRQPARSPQPGAVARPSTSAAKAVGLPAPAPLAARSAPLHRRSRGQQTAPHRGDRVRGGR